MKVTGKQIVAGVTLLVTGYMLGFKRAVDKCEKDIYKAFFDYVEDVVAKKKNEGEA